MCDELLEDRSTRNVHLVWQFILECEKGVLGLAQKGDGLPYREQTELVELLLRLEDTKRRLRRSVRRAASVPVLLCSGLPGHAWEEKTETLYLSRYGTALKCQHAVQTEEIISIVRLDTGRETKARVVWTKLKDDQQYEIGVEHLGRDNFWGWDWTTEGMHCHNSPMYLDITGGEGSLEFILSTVEVGDHPTRDSQHSVSSSLGPRPKDRKSLMERK